MPYPDFLCIGAQKSGTTWLYHQLRLHPEIWVPPIKELHYFDWRLKSRLIYAIHYNSLKGKFIRFRIILLLKKESRNWARHFFFDNRNYENYQNLFQPSLSQVSGEITPSYARLDGDIIEQVHKYMPDLKLIYLFRNPVERAWSQMNMYRRRPDVYSSTPYTEVFKRKEEKIIRNSSYTKNLDEWMKHYTSSQLFIGFYEQIKEDPRDLLEDIFAFLGVDQKYSSHELKESIEKPRNQGHYDAIPVEIEYQLTKDLLPEIEGIHERLNNQYTQKWLEQAYKVLNKR